MKHKIKLVPMAVSNTPEMIRAEADALATRWRLWLISLFVIAAIALGLGVWFYRPELVGHICLAILIAMIPLMKALAGGGAKNC